MVKAQIYTLKGTKTGEFTLPKGMFEVTPNLNLLAQAVHVYEERGHVGLRKTKTRSEVNRTTKKVYKQKGTGGARHGSRRANVFVGGGVALGPRPERRILTLPQALRNKAKIYAFSLKAKEKEIIVISGLSKIAKTKEAGEFLAKVGKDANAFDIYTGGILVLDENIFESVKESKASKPVKSVKATKTVKAISRSNKLTKKTK